MTKTQYEQLFDMLTSSYKYIMDFRQFLCCISLLVRGSIIDKINLYFDIYNQAFSYISKNTFLFYMDVIFKSVMYLIEIKQLENKYQQFVQRI